MSSAGPIIEVEGLGKRYQLGTGHTGAGGWLKRLTGRGRGEGKARELGHIWALRDISFNIAAGERVGIIGRNGAGKSTLLKILSRVVYPTEGEARLQGRVTSLLEVGTGFNDNLTGRENVYLNAAFHGLGRQEVDARFEDITAFAEIGSFIDTPIKFYSSGMRARLAFSVAAHLDPDILMLDEVLSVGDMGFQQKCLAKMQSLTGNDRTLLFVSHSIDAMHRFCDRAIWLDQGRIKADGAVADVTKAYVEAAQSVKASFRRDDTAEGDESQTTDAAVDETPTPPQQDDLKKNHPEAAVKKNPGPETLSPEPVKQGADLLDATILDARGGRSSLLAVEQPIGIDFQFEAFQPGLYVPSIGLYCPAGTLIFWSVPGWTDHDHYRLSAGTHHARVWLPKDLLNIGVYTVTIALVDPSYAPMRRYVNAERILSFQTVSTPGLELQAKGILPRDFPGPLRPRLDWSLTLASDAKITERTA